MLKEELAKLLLIHTLQRVHFQQVADHRSVNVWIVSVLLENSQSSAEQLPVNVSLSNPENILHWLEATGREKGQPHGENLRLAVIFVIHGTQLEPDNIFRRKIVKSFLEDCSLEGGKVARPRELAGYLSLLVGVEENVFGLQISNFHSLQNHGFSGRNHDIE